MPLRKFIKKGSHSDVDVDCANVDTVDRPSKTFHVTLWDITGLIYSIIIHIVDVAFDINVAYHYFKNKEYAYFIWTLAFMLVPAVIITVLSMRMYVVDNDHSSVSRIAVQRRFLCLLVLLLQLASVIRYCDSLNYALRSRRAEKQGDRKKQQKFYKKMLSEDSDVALLRVFECYLESAPQQILQITILLLDQQSKKGSFHILQQSLSIGSSFLAMAWCMASYHRSIRFDQENKNNISWMGTIVQFLWHLFVTVSRIVSISVIASIYPLWTGIGVVVHWLAMSVWIAFMSNTNFCRQSKILECLFSAALGLVYIFNFMSVKEGPTRYYYLAFYPICFIQNITAAAVWALEFYSVKPYVKLSKCTFYTLISVPVVSFLLGMIFMGIYYQFLHPNRRVNTKRRNGAGSPSLGGGDVEVVYTCNGSKMPEQGGGDVFNICDSAQEVRV
ncbi:UNVERIFIED_CONTAM: hypothetical protein PYX00_005557 [Menopon gallinae]|uniref:XK-related protein n=1 Tax=Menopon gallinae TaxID=328185 RepID=A0AAW2HRX0_9NEOP